MKRNPRKVRWTKAFRKATGKEMTIDASLEFEKKRNVPVRYDRDLMETTVKAMKRVEEIRAKRDRLHYLTRGSMKNKVAMDDRQSQTIIRQGRHLLSQPVVGRERVHLPSADSLLITEKIKGSSPVAVAAERPVRKSKSTLQKTKAVAAVQSRMQIDG